MPSPSYAWLKINGTEIPGGVSVAGREGSIEVIKFDHDVRVPTQHEGRAAGKRQHDPITLVKIFDPSSPSLYQALGQQQTIELRIDWYRIDDTGTEGIYFTHHITGGRVVGMRAFMPNIKDAATEKYTHHEEVKITYSSITWTNVEGSQEYTDDWFTPAV
jgi:type VI secretion system secreted protein Hcp